MQHAQRGITILGLIIMVSFIGIFLYAIIRLTPLFIEDLEVSRAFDSLQAETNGVISPQTVRNAIEKRFEIDDVKSLDWRDVEISKDGDEWTVHGAWDAQAPFIANVGFIVHFDKSITLKSS